VNVLFLVDPAAFSSHVVVETAAAAEYTRRTKWDGSTDARKAKVITRLHHSMCRLFRGRRRIMTGKTRLAFANALWKTLRVIYTTAWIF
jgi:hypothetical protein